MWLVEKAHGFVVHYSEMDVFDFNCQWPGSYIEGEGHFEFDTNGDLIDLGGSAVNSTGDEWVVFSDVCKRWGFERLRFIHEI